MISSTHYPPTKLRLYLTRTRHSSPKQWELCRITSTHDKMLNSNATSFVTPIKNSTRQSRSITHASCKSRRCVISRTQTLNWSHSWSLVVPTTRQRERDWASLMSLLTPCCNSRKHWNWRINNIRRFVKRHQSTKSAAIRQRENNKSVVNNRNRHRVPVSTAVAAGHIREDNNSVPPAASHASDATSLTTLQSGAKVTGTIVQDPFLDRHSAVSNESINWTAMETATTHMSSMLSTPTSFYLTLEWKLRTLSCTC